MDKYKIRRFVIYISGLLIVALGIALSIRSQLGVSPVTSIPSVLNLTTGVSVGSITFGLYLLFIMAQIIILRKEFRKRDWLQIVFSSIFGIFTDIFLYLTLFINFDSIILKLVLCLCSCMVIAFGVFLVVTTDVIMNAPDALCNAISKKYDKKFGNVKIRFDLTLVLIAALISIFSFGGLEQIGIGTIVAALLIGRLVNIFIGKYKDKVESYYMV
ncbi:MAG: DUF6198 family protein [Clostridium sp.]